MRLGSKNWLRVATLLGAVALLGACCWTPPPEWPPPQPDQPPVLERDIQRGTMHWDRSNHWPRYRYR